MFSLYTLFPFCSEILLLLHLFLDDRKNNMQKILRFLRYSFSDHVYLSRKCGPNRNGFMKSRNSRSCAPDTHTLCISGLYFMIILVRHWTPISWWVLEALPKFLFQFSFTWKEYCLLAPGELHGLNQRMVNGDDWDIHLKKGSEQTATTKQAMCLHLTSLHDAYLWETMTLVAQLLCGHPVWESGVCYMSGMLLLSGLCMRRRVLVHCTSTICLSV